MDGILRIPAVEIFVMGTDKGKEYTLSSTVSSIDLYDITIMEIYDEHTGRTINRYIVSESCERYRKCEKCAFSIYNKDRISGVCTRSISCRGNDLIFLPADKLLEDI